MSASAKILYYVHDPMCSWCWGFQPVWRKIQRDLPSNIEIKYILGGLAPDSNIPMTDTMKVEIARYWKKIQSHIPETEFNYDFWTSCIPKRSTYPACRAVIAARKQDPMLEGKMISTIQEAYYLQARNPSEQDVLLELAVSIGLDKSQFIEDLSSSSTQKILDDEIIFSRQIGAQGFPSMILEKAGYYQYVPLDYNDSKVAVAFINSS